MKKRLILLALVTLFISGCSKFEEGPEFSLRTKKSRITNDWVLTKTSYGDKVTTQTSNRNFKIDRDGTYLNNVSTDIASIKGNWALDVKKRKDILHYVDLSIKTQEIDPEEKVVTLIFDENIWYQYIVYRLTSDELTIGIAGDAYGRYYFEAK